VERRLDQGRDMVFVQISHDLSTLKMWFDPNVNYLLRKVVMSPKKSRDEGYVECEVIHFREYSPAVYFPEVIEHRTYREGRLSGTKTVKLESAVVNEPISARLFQLNFPVGIRVADQMQGKTYKVGLGESEADGTQRPLAIGPAVSGRPEGGLQTETRVEQVPRSHLILPLSLAVLIVVVGVSVFRRFKDNSP